ncbi:MAG: ATP-binding protein [Microgenomates group bacterium]
MIPRTISLMLKKAVKTFPAIVLTGPRQSGKTTLLKHDFGQSHKYYSLEAPDTRIRAKDDPLGFINYLQKPAILDEIQYVPELLPYIKEDIDKNRQPGRWILTGSQNFVLMENISQSLAGRAAILSLLSFSVSERFKLGLKSLSTEKLFSLKRYPPLKVDFNLPEIILRGSYPEIASNLAVDRSLWSGSYINTYLERDIRNLKQVGDLREYEMFLRACAVRTGQILDLSSISREIGVSFTTAKRWLSLLEIGYQVFLLYPYYRNIGKRLVKRPKIYFTDTGLVSYLLNINTEENLINSPFFGPLFETLVVTDFLKRFLHHGQIPSMYYLQTRDKLEIDLVIELENKLHLIEIKSSSTIKKEHASSLIRAKRDLDKLIATATILSNTQEQFPIVNNIINIPAKFILPK